MWRRVALVVALGVSASCSGDGGEASDPVADPTVPATADTVPEDPPPPATTVPEGSSTLDDPYVPGAGSDGFDVIDQTVRLEVDPAQGRLDGTAELNVELTEAVGAIFLDLEPALGVVEIEVDDLPATFEHDDRELRITLPQVGGPGDRHELRIDYGGRPEPLVGVVPFTPVGWSTTSWGALAVSEPRGTATWTPVVDHPSDKATWVVEATVPDPFEAVASGQLVERRREPDGRSTFRWEVDAPMAPHAALLLVADLTVTSRNDVGGLDVTVAAPTVTPEIEAVVDRLPAMVDALESWFGPYPFDAFGLAVPPGPLGFAALETQELPLFDDRVLADPGSSVVVHELAHQWAGNHVSVERWDDIWLAEGMATYAEWLWFEASEGESADVLAELYLDTAGPTQLLPPGTPPLDALFGPSVYGRSALGFHDLREQVGDETFRALLTTWFDRFGGGNASTEDWLALVEEVAGEAAAERMRSWAFDETVPD